MATNTSMAVQALLAKKGIQAAAMRNSATRARARRGSFHGPARRGESDGNENLGTGRHLLAEDARGTEEKDEDEQAEGDDIAPLVAKVNAWNLVEEFAADRLRQAEGIAACDRARDAADTAEHGRGKGLDAGQEAHRTPDGLEEQPVEDTGDTGHGRAQQEDDDDCAIDVDAHEGGVARILCHGTDGAARPGALHDEE